MQQKLQRKVVSLLELVRFLKRQKIKRELQKAIDSCKTIDELRILVFSTQNKDEAMDRAFCKKLEELERQA
jgi:hypothetical protein